MTVPRDVPSHIDLENLFVNNEIIDRIGIYLNRFNPIRIMKMEKMELRHSAILSWLLDPRETHGFSDRFLKAFLAEALRGHSDMGSPTAIEISQCDLRDAEIRREWQKIDILILCPEVGWAFVIENKFYARQRAGQLSEYIKKIDSIFAQPDKKLKVHGVFLTLQDEEPEDEKYIPLRYKAICEFLPQLLAQRDQKVSQEVRVFLEHYLEIIRDEAGMSEERIEMERLARQLYRNHKRVLDFVMEHGASTDFVTAADSVFGEEKKSGDIVEVDRGKFMYDRHNNHQFSFLPIAWKEAFDNGDSWPGCEGWWAGYPLICWFRLLMTKRNYGTKGNLRLFAEVGPISNHSLRKNLINCIKQATDHNNPNLVRFQQGADLEGRRYSRFFTKNSVVINDVHDAEEIATSMRKMLVKFQPYFDDVEKGIKDPNLHFIVG